MIAGSMHGFLVCLHASMSSDLDFCGDWYGGGTCELNGTRRGRGKLGMWGGAVGMRVGVGVG